MRALYPPRPYSPTAEHPALVHAAHVSRVVGMVLLVLVVALAVVLVTLRLLGCTPFAVLSGSMEPTYPVGSLVYVRAAEGADVRPGDPVTFVADERGTVATHRVVAVDTDAQLLITKGDANNTLDGSPVSFANVIGRPFVCIPGAGYVAAWLWQPPGIVVVGVALVALAAWAFVPRANGGGRTENAVACRKGRRRGCR